MIGLGNLTCYTGDIVTRGLICTLLMASGLWIPFHTSLLSRMGMGECQSACMPSCCMHGGMCPMMARNYHSESQSLKARPVAQSHSAVGCSCSLSNSNSPFTMSQSNLIYGRPVFRPLSKLSASLYQDDKDFCLIAAAPSNLPDPPPKAFFS